MIGSKEELFRTVKCKDLKFHIKNILNVRAYKETDKKLWENFIDRQLRDTQYIARKSREILQKVCNNVTTTEGGVTAKLRNVWGWNDVLMNLQMPKYKDWGKPLSKNGQGSRQKRKHQKKK